MQLEHAQNVMFALVKQTCTNSSTSNNTQSNVLYSVRFSGTAMYDRYIGYWYRYSRSEWKRSWDYAQRSQRYSSPHLPALLRRSHPPPRQQTASNNNNQNQVYSNKNISYSMSLSIAHTQLFQYIRDCNI